MHLDVDVGAISEAHEDVEDRAFVVQVAGLDFGIAHLDVSDGRGRVENGCEELDQEWSVLFGCEEALEDDVGLRVESLFGGSEIGAAPAERAIGLDTKRVDFTHAASVGPVPASVA